MRHYVKSIQLTYLGITDITIQFMINSHIFRRVQSRMSLRNFMLSLQKCSAIEKPSGLRLRKYTFPTSGLHRRPFNFFIRAWAVQYHLNIDSLTKSRILHV
jgi:hypothetical protein